MPFRRRSVSVLRVFCAPLVERVESDMNSGVTINKLVKIYDTLPDVEDYKLKTLLDAGIPIQKVSTKLIHPGISEATEFLDNVKELAVPAAPAAPASPGGSSDE